MTEYSTGPCEESDSKHQWVEKLFPQRFTFQHLLEGKMYSAEEPQTDYTPLKLLSDHTRKSRKQIYLSVKEYSRKSWPRGGIWYKEWAEMTQDRHRAHGDEMDKQVYEIMNTDCNKGERCIWNQEDISTIQVALNEIEGDRRRLKDQLKTSEEQLSTEQEKKKRRQGLLEEREEQAKSSRKQTAIKHWW